MSEARGITKTIDLEVIDNIFGSIVLGISGTTWTFGGYRDIAKTLQSNLKSFPICRRGIKLK